MRLAYLLLLILTCCSAKAQDSTAIAKPKIITESVDSLSAATADSTAKEVIDYVLEGKFERERLWFITPGDQPSRALAMSAAMPGLGHLYNGQKKRAILWTGLFAGATAFSIYAHEQKPSLKRESGALLAGVYGLSMLDAFVYSQIKKEDMLHSPAKAAYLSALLPGLGQAYNGNSWKSPLVTATIGTAIFGVFYFDYLHDKYRTLYIENDFDSTFQGRKDRYRRNKQLMIIVSSGLYLLNVLDAFVDAHLHDFDVEDDLSLRPTLGIHPINLGLYTGMRLSINLH